MSGCGVCCAQALPLPQLQQQGGLLFLWVINAKYSVGLAMLDAWGYT
jgi:mRNA (2'-O-methyladenosine-N6-)-methyltransferase